jgi:hypothetical protein
MAPPLLQAGAAAALWVGLYELNAWMFSAFEHSQTISWIFLPAAVRLLVLLLWGWRGALGLWLGALVTNVPVFGVLTAASLLAATASAAAPCLAVGLGRSVFGLATSLHGLTSGALLKLAALNAACSVALACVFTDIWGVRSLADGGAMFVGDLVGTLIVLYASRALLRLGDHIGQRIA